MASTSIFAPLGGFRMLLCAAAAWVVLMLAGCTAAPPIPEPVVEPPQPPVPEVVTSVPPPKPVALPTPPVVPPVVPPKPPVAIVVSSDLPTFRQVEDALVARLDRPYRVYRLDTNSMSDIREALKRQPVKTAIAIGRAALDVLEGVPKLDVIYAQIFVAPSDRFRGVAAVPPFDMQLEYWKSLSPGLKRIGVIGSANMRSIVDSLQTSAEAHGIKLVRREVTSDKEALVEFRRMTPDIDGFVFLPDDSVLSPDVIRRAMQHGARNDKQILTYSPAIFRLGAYLYIASEQADVATQIIAMLDDPNDHNRPLTEMRVRVQGADTDIDVVSR
jgi:ABC transporter substrate binding protein